MTAHCCAALRHQMPTCRQRLQSCLLRRVRRGQGGRGGPGEAKRPWPRHRPPRLGAAACPHRQVLRRRRPRGATRAVGGPRREPPELWRLDAAAARGGATTPRRAPLQRCREAERPPPPGTEARHARRGGAAGAAEGGGGAARQAARTGAAATGRRCGNLRRANPARKNWPLTSPRKAGEPRDPNPSPTTLAGR